MSHTVSHEMQAEISTWVSRLVAVAFVNDEEEGEVEAKGGYLRIYHGPSKRKRGAPLVSGIAWTEGMDPRPLIDTVCRHVGGIDEAGKVWIEAYYRGEKNATDYLPLSVEGNPDEEAPEDGTPGDALAGALVSTNRLLASLVRGYAGQVGELHQQTLQAVHQIGTMEGGQGDQGMQALAGVIETLAPAAMMAAQGYAQASAARAAQAPAQPAQETAQEGQEETSEAPEVDEIETIQNAAETLFARAMAGGLTEEDKARLSGLLEQLDAARPFLGGAE